MSRLLPLILCALAVSALGACKPVESAPPTSRAPAAKVVGEPVSCIQTNLIRATQVHDDRTIDFEMLGRKIYRNTLPHSCPRFGFERAFTYETSINQLCSTDIIYVLENVGGQMQRRAGCGLGQFVPVEIVKK
jgi:hypothetical protein